MVALERRQTGLGTTWLLQDRRASDWLRLWEERLLNYEPPHLDRKEREWFYEQSQLPPPEVWR